MSHDTPQTATPSQTVLVTGASGYIAGWIVKYLLDEGHTVHATVRDPSRAASVAHLQALAKDAPGRLKLFKAELLTPGSYDEATQGCDIVMHTASPFVMDGFKDANEALVRPAVEGTRNVLESVARCSSVKRVVLTSSAASVYGDNIEIKDKAKGMFTEADWNDTSSVDHNPYQFSKVAAEREAWRLQKLTPRWDLVTINPVMVFGPSLTSSSNSASIDTLLQMADGRLRSGVPDLQFGVVDVRDVARAHLLAAFKPEANGRHILCAEVLSMMGMVRLLKAKYGSQYPFPLMVAPKAVTWLVGPLLGPVSRKFVSRNVGHPIKVDNSRSRQALGVSYRTAQDTLQAHFQQVIDDGLLKKRA
ncbi:MAG: aldehyde reductase [Aquabacterium sp.]|nr:aldehyde reductase [Aquabacterium sp.]